jgi:hypothetical protein
MTAAAAPRLEEVTRLGPGLLPLTVTISGNDYFKCPVSGRLCQDASGLSWESDAERGKRSPYQ